MRISFKLLFFVFFCGSTAQVFAEKSSLVSFDTLEAPPFDKALESIYRFNCGAELFRLLLSGQAAETRQKLEAATRDILRRKYANWRSGSKSARRLISQSLATGLHPMPEIQASLKALEAAEFKKSQNILMIMMDRLRQSSQNQTDPVHEDFQIIFSLARFVEEFLTAKGHASTDGVSTTDKVFLDLPTLIKVRPDIGKEIERRKNLMVPVSSTLIKSFLEFIRISNLTTSLSETLKYDAAFHSMDSFEIGFTFFTLFGVFEVKSPFYSSLSEYHPLFDPNQTLQYLKVLKNNREFSFPALAFEGPVNALFRIIFSGLSAHLPIHAFQPKGLLKYGNILIVTPYFQLSVWHNSDESLVSGAQIHFMTAEDLKNILPQSTVQNTYTQGSFQTQNPSFKSVLAEPVVDRMPMTEDWTMPQTQRLTLDSEIKMALKDASDELVPLIENIKYRNEDEKEFLSEAIEILAEEYPEIVETKEFWPRTLNQLNTIKSLSEQSRDQKISKWRHILNQFEFPKKSAPVSATTDKDLDPFIDGLSPVENIIPEFSYELQIAGFSNIKNIRFSKETIQFLKDNPRYSHRFLKALRHGFCPAEGKAGVKIIHKHKLYSYEVKILGNFSHYRIGIIDVPSKNEWYLENSFNWDSL